MKFHPFLQNFLNKLLYAKRQRGGLHEVRFKLKNLRFVDVVSVVRCVCLSFAGIPSCCVRRGVDAAPRCCVRRGIDAAPRCCVRRGIDAAPRCCVRRGIDADITRVCRCVACVGIEHIFDILRRSKLYAFHAFVIAAVCPFGV